MRLVVTKETLLRDLNVVAHLLETGRKQATDSNWRWRLGKLAVETTDLLDEIRDYFEERRAPAAIPTELGRTIRTLCKQGQDSVESLVSLAYSYAGGLEGGLKERFKMPPHLQEKLRALAQGILRCLHEMREHR